MVANKQRTGKALTPGASLEWSPVAPQHRPEPLVTQPRMVSTGMPVNSLTRWNEARNDSVGAACDAPGRARQTRSLVSASYLLGLTRSLRFS